MQNCGAELGEQKPGDPQEPCPKCDSLARIITATVKDGMKMSAYLKDKIKRSTDKDQ